MSDRETFAIPADLYALLVEQRDAWLAYKEAIATYAIADIDGEAAALHLGPISARHVRAINRLAAWSRDHIAATDALAGKDGAA